jgi:CBS domain-containing protein/ribosome-associated translation inhibitor RaiA
MGSAFEISAEQVMNRDPVTATTEDSISQIKNSMEENDLRVIPLVGEDGSFEGAISYRELVRFIQFNPEITAPEKIVHQPPEFEASDSLVELSDLRINSGRKMLVMVENDHLTGIIGDSEFLEALQEVEELEEVSTGRLATRELVTVNEDDVLDRARHAILDNNISRLPVLDSEGRLAGMLDSVDLLKMLVPREAQASGGTAGDRSGRDEVNIAGGKEKDDMSEITVDQLMQENLLTSDSHMSALEAVEKMKERDEDDIIFVDDYPEAIVTLKDVVDYLAELAQQQTILVQLTGVDLPEEKAVLNNKLKNQLQGSLGRKLEKPEELKVVVKKAEKDGKKHRWELNLQLTSEYGVINVNEEGWELLDALDEALDELNRIVRDKHDRETEHR